MQPNATIEKAIVSVMPTIKSIALLLDRKNADDITQDVMLKLLKMRPAADQIKGQWLSRVVRNVITDKYRAQGREAQYLDRSVNLDTTGAVCEGLNEHRWYAPLPFDPQSMEDCAIPTVSEKLRELSAPHRQVLVLIASGYTNEQISAMTGASLGTVKSRIHYARKHARKLLEQILN